MAIRLSGMVSGMDTESLVSALVSSYSLKKDNLVKAQTKLSWKQEKWKTMNTSIYSFYSGKLSNARFTSNYNLKSSTVSNDKYAKVTASSSAVNGTQELKVKQLAATGYLTGGKITAADGTKVTGSTKLSDITGATENGSISITTGSETKSIELTEDMTVNQFVAKLKDAGVNASFDENNARFFISAKESGADNDFKMEATDDNGLTALKKLGIYTGEDDPSDGAVRITGQDAEIELNGATFTNNTNDFSINGLTIQALEVSGNDKVTITTNTDVDGIYNKIKDFLKDYNELVKSIDVAYNASSAKGYEPLTSDEKDAMSDDEVEKWETKIKDSLLRKDSTLGSVLDTMKNDMAQSFEINGTSYSLSSFGIATLGYFNSPENETGVYHIDGDSDDSKTSANTDKLKSMIASDPDTVISFFSQLSSKLYTDLGNKMAASSTSSAYTIYNDKQMNTQYSEYTTKITEAEEKVTTWEDYYYSKFSAMESALAKMNSQSSSLSGLFS